VCYKHLTQIRKALNIPGGARIGTWRYVSKQGDKESGAQIDLLFDRDDGAVTVCEIKYTDKPFVIDKKCYQNILNKINSYKIIAKTTKQIIVTFISARGIKSSIYSKELLDSVVTLDDLFKKDGS